MFSPNRFKISEIENFTNQHSNEKMKKKSHNKLEIEIEKESI
jgi:hypothetical protein